MNKAIIKIGGSAIQRIAGIALKIGGVLYNIESLTGKTLYATRDVKVHRQRRMNSQQWEDITIKAGEPLGVLEAWNYSGGSLQLRFPWTVKEHNSGQDYVATYPVTYSPGLLELDAIKAQGTKDVKQEVEEQRKKEEAENSMFPSIPNPFEGLGKELPKYLGIGAALVGGVILLKYFMSDDNTRRLPPPRYPYY